MNISKIAFTALPLINKANTQPKLNPYMTQGLQKDIFEHSDSVNFKGSKPKQDSALNTAQLKNYFLNLKDEENKPKFKPEEVNQLSNIINKTPEKTVSVKALATNPEILGDEVVKLAKKPLPKLNKLVELSKIKDEEGALRFNGYELIILSSIKTEDFDKVKPLAKTKLYAESMIETVADKNLDINKVVVKAKKLEKTVKDELDGGIALAKDIYDNSTYVMTADLLNYGSKNELLDKNMNVLACEKVDLQFASKDYQIIKTNDYRNNTVSKIRMEVPKDGVPVMTHEIRIIKDKNGNTQRTEYTAPSEIKGVYNTRYEYPDGKIEKVAQGNIRHSEQGKITSVKKDFKSLDGTRTQFLYEDDDTGNRIVDYKITSKNGKVLYNESRTFEVLADNKFRTSSKNNLHEIVLTPQNMKITDLNTQKETTLQFKNLIKSNKKIIVSLLKKVPGEELVKRQDTTKKIKGAKSSEDCYLEPDAKEISTLDDLYIFLHELGHSKDFENVKPTDEEENGIYSDDTKLQEIYMEEKTAFNKAFPNAQRNHINYFIDQTEHYSGEWGGLGEVIAEANALVQTYNKDPDLASRSQYLQQYFPNTIAYLGNKFNEKTS